MKIRVFEDEVNYTKTTPFEIELDGVVYKGVLTERGSVVGTIEADPDYEITWNGNALDIETEELIDMLLKEIYQME